MFLTLSQDIHGARMIPYKPARLFVTDSQRLFEPVIQNTPALPAIDWSRLGQTAPTLLNSSSGNLPTADAIIITWANAEWAAMQHVFCASGTSMPYSQRNTSSWGGWQNYAQSLPTDTPSGWTYWGEWRLVQIAGHRVMLFKSNTHLDWPGKNYLQDMIGILIRDVKPSLLLSIGTAGGTRLLDHIGTVQAVSAGTLYEQDTSQSEWPIYKNAWVAAETILNQAEFSELLFPIPTTASDLEALSKQFNQYYKTSYSLSELDTSGLNIGDPSPKIDNQTGGATSVLTTSTFVVGTTLGSYQSYACIEMDDAIMDQICASAGVAFGSVRNISDPVQDDALPSEVQGEWGSAVYDSYGFYTSYNGALVAWAILVGQFSE